MPTQQEILAIMQAAKKKPVDAISEAPSITSKEETIKSVDIIREDLDLATELRRMSILLSQLKNVLLGVTLPGNHKDFEVWKL